MGAGSRAGGGGGAACGSAVAGNAGKGAVYGSTNAPDDDAAACGGVEGFGTGIDPGAEPAALGMANGYCAFAAAMRLTEPGMMLVSASSSIGAFTRSAGIRGAPGMGGGFGGGTQAPGDEPGDEPVRGGGTAGGSDPGIAGGGTEPLAFFSFAVAVICPIRSIKSCPSGGAKGASAWANACTFRKRASGSFAKAQPITFSNSTGMSRRSSDNGCGASRMICSMSAAASP